MQEATDTSTAKLSNVCGTSCDAMNEPLEIRLRKLTDQAGEMIPAMSGAHIEQYRNFHHFLADVLDRELKKRRAQ